MNARLAKQRKARKVVPIMTCCKAGTCTKASECSMGKPHKLNIQLDLVGICFDHRPYVDGGIRVWGTLARKDSENA
jgi:hypothetical protein